MSAGQSYSLKSGDSFGRLRRWYLLGSIHKVAMATGQPGLSTPRPKSGKPVGPTNGRMYPGVRYWWLVVRANLRRADSRSRYTCLSHRWNYFVCIANPEQERTRRSRGLPICRYNSQFSRSICIFVPQNPTYSWGLPTKLSTQFFPSFPFLHGSQPLLHSLLKKTHRFASPGGDFICIEKEFEIRNKIFPNF